MLLPRLLLPLLLAATSAFPLTPLAADPPARYETRAEHHPDGIGKFYMGREIAQVMGHQGASWLERPEREDEERPDLLIPLLNLKAGQAVADIGAGSGYHTRRMAQLVAPTGKVYGVDIQQEMLDLLTADSKKRGLTNIVAVLGTETDPKLPANTLDLILLVDVYHEFSYPYEMVEAICKALKPGGRIAFVEFKAEDPAIPIKGLHKMSEAQLRKEMTPHPLEWIETHRSLPWQHLILFRRTDPKAETRNQKAETLPPPSPTRTPKPEPLLPYLGFRTRTV